jgi:hypothetical protein
VCSGEYDGWIEGGNGLVVGCRWLVGSGESGGLQRGCRRCGSCRLECFGSFVGCVGVDFWIRKRAHAEY